MEVVIEIAALTELSYDVTVVHTEVDVEASDDSRMAQFPQNSHLTL